MRAECRCRAAVRARTRASSRRCERSVFAPILPAEHRRPSRRARTPDSSPAASPTSARQVGWRAAYAKTASPTITRASCNFFFTLTRFWRTASYENSGAYPASFRGAHARCTRRSPSSPQERRGARRRREERRRVREIERVALRIIRSLGELQVDQRDPVTGDERVAWMRVVEDPCPPHGPRRGRGDTPRTRSTPPTRERESPHGTCSRNSMTAAAGFAAITRGETMPARCQVFEAPPPRAARERRASGHRDTAAGRTAAHRTRGPSRRSSRA